MNIVGLVLGLFGGHLAPSAEILIEDALKGAGEYTALQSAKPGDSIPVATSTNVVAGRKVRFHLTAEVLQ